MIKQIKTHIVYIDNSGMNRTFIGNINVEDKEQFNWNNSNIQQVIPQLKNMDSFKVISVNKEDSLDWEKKYISKF